MRSTYLGRIGVVYTWQILPEYCNSPTVPPHRAYPVPSTGFRIVFGHGRGWYEVMKCTYGYMTLMGGKST